MNFYFLNEYFNLSSIAHLLMKRRKARQGLRFIGEPNDLIRISFYILEILLRQLQVLDKWKFSVLIENKYGHETIFSQPTDFNRIYAH